jgi:hypothetical protein
VGGELRQLPHPQVRFGGAVGRPGRQPERGRLFPPQRHALRVAPPRGSGREVRLSEREPDRPALARAGGLIRKVERGDHFWRAECRNWSKSFIELWAPEGNWRATTKIPGGKDGGGPAKRLEDGRVRFELPAGAGKWLEIRFEY